MDERDAAMDRTILIDLRTEVGSEKTAPATASLAARSEFAKFVVVRHDVRDR